MGSLVCFFLFDKKENLGRTRTLSSYFKFNGKENRPIFGTPESRPEAKS